MSILVDSIISITYVTKSINKNASKSQQQDLENPQHCTPRHHCTMHLNTNKSSSPHYCNRNLCHHHAATATIYKASNGAQSEIWLPFPMPPLHKPSPPVPPSSSIPRHDRQQHHRLTPTITVKTTKTWKLLPPIQQLKKNTINTIRATAATIYAITIGIYTATATICRASNDLGRCWYDLQSRNASLTTLTVKMVERQSLMEMLSDDEC